MKSVEEIQKQIEGLKKMKNTLPEYNFFGDNNWVSIDVQLDILEGVKDYDDYENDEPDIERAAYDADEWLNGDRTEDLFDE